MEITKHIAKRFAERILNIKDDFEANKYANTYFEDCKTQILQIYHYSKWLYKGQIGNDKVVANFYINDDIILVGDVQETKLYTIYRVDFDFPPETNKKVVYDLVDVIKDLRIELDSIQADINGYIEEKQHTIEECDIQIKNLKEQIEILERKKRIAKDEMDCKNDELGFINKKIESYANKLCNSLEFKRDSLTNMIKSS